MGLWGSQSKFVVGSDKIRSGRLIERRSGDAGREMQEGGKPNAPHCTNMQRGSIVSRLGINVNNANHGKGRIGGTE